MISFFSQRLTGLKLAFMFVLVAMLSSTQVFSANEDKCKNSKSEKVKTGVVASVGTYSGPAAVNSDTSESTPGEEASKISGAIKNITNKKCAAVVMNSSECNRYNVSFQVNASKKSSGDSRIITSSSANLSPKSSKEVAFSCNAEEFNYSVEVTKVK